MKEELLKGLTEEQIAKVKACKNQEELLTLAKEEGIELTDEQLEAVSGGCGTISGLYCPRCGKEAIFRITSVYSMYDTYKCSSCDYTWEEKKPHRI